MGCGSSRVGSSSVDCADPPAGNAVRMEKVNGIPPENNRTAVQQVNGIDNKVFVITKSIEDIQSTIKKSDVPVKLSNGSDNIFEDGSDDLNITEIEGNASILSGLGKHEDRKKNMYTSLDVFVDADNTALTAPDCLKHSTNELVAYLTEQFQHSDLLKLRVIWRWVTHNIEYDVESYFNPNTISAKEEAENVLLSGKSVCSGYSNLFKTMGSLAGLHIECISGWSKGYEFVLGASFGEADTNHLWNAALLNNSWWLFDCTWGAGYIDENKNFVKQYDDHFFMTDPYQFIYDHLPKDSKWQLLETPITMNEYENMGLFTRHFFQANMKPVNHKNFRIECNDGKVHLKFKILKNNPVSCVGSLFDPDGIQASEQLIHIYRTDKVLHTHILVPDVGEFKLKLYAAVASLALKDEATLPIICTYLINCTYKVNIIQTYPKQFKKWCSGFMLHSPMEGHLRIGETYKFRISVTAVEKMAVCFGGRISTVTYLENTKGKVWERDVEILPGTERITVVAKFSNCKNSTFSSLLEYTVKTDDSKPYVE